MLEVEIRLRDVRLDSEAYRIAFRDIAASTNERTMIACILPPGTFCPDTVKLEGVFYDCVEEGQLHLNRQRLNAAEKLFLLAVRIKKNK